MRKVELEIIDGCPECGKPEFQELHTCPYEVDINDNDETLCRCCVDCENTCADEI